MFFLLFYSRNITFVRILKLIHRKEASIFMSCVKLKLGLGYNVAACGRSGKLIAGSAVVWPRGILRKCSQFSHTQLGGKVYSFSTVCVRCFNKANFHNVKKINPFLSFTLRYSWNGIWNPFLLQFLLQSRKKQNYCYLHRNHDNIKQRESPSFFLSICKNWMQTCASLM